MAKFAVVQEIKPKHGELKDIHLDIVGCECSVARVELSKLPCLVINVPLTNSGSCRTVITSDVESYDECDGYIKAETFNSVYLFKM